MLTRLDSEPHESPVPFFTPREHEAFRLIAQELRTHEMTGEINLSFHTIETYRKHLIAKFRSMNTTELVKKASKSFWP